MPKKEHLGSLDDPENRENREVLLLQQIREFVQREIHQFNQGHYAHVICALGTGGVAGEAGNIFELAKKLGWSPPLNPDGFPEEYQQEPGLALPVDYDLNTQWATYLSQSIASQSSVQTPPNYPTKSITVRFLQGLHVVRTYENPVNLYQPTIQYNSEIVNKIARENALVLIEEWLHVLQFETNSYLSKHFKQQTYVNISKEAELDVACFMIDFGVDLNGTIFVRRYGRQGFLDTLE